MTKNEQIFIDYDSGKISLDEALGAIKKLPKVWSRKEWKEKRKKLIKENCEYCNRSGRMVLNHKWHPREAGDIRREYVKDNIKFKEDDFYSWFWSFYEKAKKINPIKWKKSANSVSHVRTEYLLYELRKRFLNTHDFKTKFKNQNRDIMEDYVFRESYKDFQRYMSMTDTHTLCHSCAAKYDYHHWGHKQ
jgi:hypothetical protein